MPFNSTPEIEARRETKVIHASNDLRHGEIRFNSSINILTKAAN